MFDLFRTHKRWALVILIILILPSFVFFGVEGYSQFFAGERALATVGQDKIQRADFDAAQRQQIDRLRQTFGGQIDVRAFDTPEARRALLDQMIEERLLLQEAQRFAFTATDDRLRREILSIPSIQRDGTFDRELYESLLRANGLSVLGFEAQLRTDIAVASVVQPLQDSALISNQIAERLLRSEREERTVRVRTFDAAALLDEATATVGDSDVQAYYDANPQAFVLPVRVDASYVVLRQEDAARGIDVTEDEISSYYEQNRARYTTEEQRRASHILFVAENDSERSAARARAQAVLSDLQADPSRFAELAREFSEDPGSAEQGGDLDWFSRGMMVAPFEEAVFTLAQGQISSVVETEFGLHIIQVTGIRPGDVRPLDAVRDEIRVEIQQQFAARRFAELSNDFDNLVYEVSDSLEPVAQQFDLALQTAALLEESSPLSGAPTAQTPLHDYPRFRQELFSDEVLREGLNSGVFEIAPGIRVALRAETVHPESRQPLEAVSDQIREILVEERAVAQAKALAEQALAADAAQRFEGVEEQVISRVEPGDLPGPVLDAVMRAPGTSLPHLQVIELPGLGASLIEVSAIQPFEGELDADLLERLSALLGRQYGAGEAQAFVMALRDERRVRIGAAAERVITQGANAAP